MDTQKDQVPFLKLLDQLCAAWDRPQGQEALGKAYWNALKDVRLSEIQANVQRILRTAHGKQPFPKPAELRNEAPTEQPSGAAFTEGERRAIEYLEELKRKDPDAWRNDVWLRKLDRILATEPQGSPIYAQALAESNRLRPLVRGY